MRHGADVVLMAVREDEGFDAAAVGVERRQVGDDQIDAEELRLGEHHAGIDRAEQCPRRRRAACSCRTRRPRRAESHPLRLRWIDLRTATTVAKPHPDTATGRADSPSIVSRGAGAPCVGLEVPGPLGRWEDPKTGWKTGRNYSTGRSPARPAQRTSVSAASSSRLSVSAPAPGSMPAALRTGAGSCDQALEAVRERLPALAEDAL